MKSIKSVMVRMLKECGTAGAQTDSTALTRQEAMVLAIIEKAMKGDLHALTFIKDLTEGKEREKTSSALPLREIVVRVEGGE